MISRQHRHKREDKLCRSLGEADYKVINVTQFVSELVDENSLITYRKTWTEFAANIVRKSNMDIASKLSEINQHYKNITSKSVALYFSRWKFQFKWRIMSRTYITQQRIINMKLISKKRIEDNQKLKHRRWIRFANKLIKRNRIIKFKQGAIECKQQRLIQKYFLTWLAQFNRYAKVRPKLINKWISFNNSLLLRRTIVKLKHAFFNLFYKRKWQNMASALIHTVTINNLYNARDRAQRQLCWTLFNVFLVTQERNEALTSAKEHLNCRRKWYNYVSKVMNYQKYANIVIAHEKMLSVQKCIQAIHKCIKKSKKNTLNAAKQELDDVRRLKKLKQYMHQWKEEHLIHSANRRMQRILFQEALQKYYENLQVNSAIIIQKAFRKIELYKTNKRYKFTAMQRWKERARLFTRKFETPEMELEFVPEIDTGLGTLFQIDANPLETVSSIIDYRANKGDPDQIAYAPDLPDIDAKVNTSVASLRAFELMELSKRKPTSTRKSAGGYVNALSAQLDLSALMACQLSALSGLDSSIIEHFNISKSRISDTDDSLESLSPIALKIPTLDAVKDVEDDEVIEDIVMDMFDIATDKLIFLSTRPPKEEPTDESFIDFLTQPLTPVPSESQLALKDISVSAHLFDLPSPISKPLKKEPRFKEAGTETPPELSLFAEASSELSKRHGRRKRRKSEDSVPSPKGGAQHHRVYRFVSTSSSSSSANILSSSSSSDEIKDKEVKIKRFTQAFSPKEEEIIDEIIDEKINNSRNEPSAETLESFQSINNHPLSSSSSTESSDEEEEPPMPARKRIRVKKIRKIPSLDPEEEIVVQKPKQKKRKVRQAHTLDASPQKDKRMPTKSKRRKQPPATMDPSDAGNDGEIVSLRKIHFLRALRKNPYATSPNSPSSPKNLAQSPPEVSEAPKRHSGRRRAQKRVKGAKTLDADTPPKEKAKHRRKYRTIHTLDPESDFEEKLRTPERKIIEKKEPQSLPTKVHRKENDVDIEDERPTNRIKELRRKKMHRRREESTQPQRRAPPLKVPSLPRLIESKKEPSSSSSSSSSSNKALIKPVIEFERSSEDESSAIEHTTLDANPSEYEQTTHDSYTELIKVEAEEAPSPRQSQQPMTDLKLYTSSTDDYSVIDELPDAIDVIKQSAPEKKVNIQPIQLAKSKIDEEITDSYVKIFKSASLSETSSSERSSSSKRPMYFGKAEIIDFIDEQLTRAVNSISADSISGAVNDLFYLKGKRPDLFERRLIHIRPPRFVENALAAVCKDFGLLLTATFSPIAPPNSFESSANPGSSSSEMDSEKERSLKEIIEANIRSDSESSSHKNKNRNKSKKMKDKPKRRHCNLIVIEQKVQKIKERRVHRLRSFTPSPNVQPLAPKLKEHHEEEPLSVTKEVSELMDITLENAVFKALRFPLNPGATYVAAVGDDSMFSDSMMPQFMDEVSGLSQISKESSGAPREVALGAAIDGLLEEFYGQIDLDFFVGITEPVEEVDEPIRYHARGVIPSFDLRKRSHSEVLFSNIKSSSAYNEDRSSTLVSREVSSSSSSTSSASESDSDSGKEKVKLKMGSRESFVSSAMASEEPIEEVSVEGIDAVEAKQEKKVKFAAVSIKPEKKAFGLSLSTIVTMEKPEVEQPTMDFAPVVDDLIVTFTRRAVGQTLDAVSTIHSNAYFTAEEIQEMYGDILREFQPPEFRFEFFEDFISNSLEGAANAVAAGTFLSKLGAVEHSVIIDAFSTEPPESDRLQKKVTKMLDFALAESVFIAVDSAARFDTRSTIPDPPEITEPVRKTNSISYFQTARRQKARLAPVASVMPGGFGLGKAVSTERFEVDVMDYKALAEQPLAVVTEEEPKLHSSSSSASLSASVKNPLASSFDSLSMNTVDPNEQEEFPDIMFDDTELADSLEFAVKGVVKQAANDLLWQIEQHCETAISMAEVKNERFTQSDAVFKLRLDYRRDIERALCETLLSDISEPRQELGLMGATCDFIGASLVQSKASAVFNGLSCFGCDIGEREKIDLDATPFLSASLMMCTKSVIADSILRSMSSLLFLSNPKEESRAKKRARNSSPRTTMFSITDSSAPPSPLLIKPPMEFERNDNEFIQKFQPPENALDIDFEENGNKFVFDEREIEESLGKALEGIRVNEFEILFEVTEYDAFEDVLEDESKHVTFPEIDIEKELDLKNMDSLSSKSSSSSSSSSEVEESYDVPRSELKLKAALDEELNLSFAITIGNLVHEVLAGTCGITFRTVAAPDPPQRPEWRESVPELIMASPRGRLSSSASSSGLFY